MEAFKLFATISLKTDEFMSGLDKASSAFGKFSNVADSIAGAIVKGMAVAGTAIAGLGGAAINAGIEYESAFAGVRKTVDATEEQFQKLSDGIRDMAKDMPMAAKDIAALAESAGQLGIKTDNILDFTKVIADLGVATNIIGQEGAAQIARFANIVGMSQTDFDKFGSSIVALGNNFATTEAEILNMSMRLAGAGAQVGMSESDILGLATALSSVGIEAEMGGSAISKVLVSMSAAGTTSDELNAVLNATGMSLRELQFASENMGFADLAHSLGMTKKELNDLIKQGANLDNFAQIAGMTGDEFRTAFEQDAVGALQSFIGGLAGAEGAGSSAIEMLQEMGITEVRLRDSLLRAAGAGDLLTDAVSLSNQAWEENDALTKEAEQRYSTMASQIEILKNKATDLGISFYESVNNPMAEVIKTAGGMIDKVSEAFASGGLSGAIASLGEVLAEAVTYIAELAPSFINVGLDLINALVEGLTSNADVILDGAMTAFTSLLDGIKELLPNLVPLAVDVLTALADGFIQYKELIWVTGVDILAQLLQGITEKLPELIPKAQEAIMNIVQGLAENLPLILQSAIDIVTQLAMGIAEMLPELIPVAIEAILTLIETLIDNVDLLIDAAIAIVIGLAEGIINALPILLEKALIIIAKLTKAIIENAPKLLEAAADILDMLAKGIVDGLSKIVELGKEIVAGIVSGVSSYIGEIIKTGKNIVEGLWQGITNTNTWLRGKIFGFFGGVVDDIKKFFGIQSPSKLFRDEIGAMLPAGLADGISKNTSKATKAAEKMAKETYGKAKTWIDNYRNGTDYLASEEIKMWEMLAEKYAAVSKEKVEIDKNINKLREQANKEVYDNSLGWINAQKALGLLSMQEEVEAWERMQNKFAEDIELRKKAEEELFKARERLFEEQEKIVSKMEAAEEKYTKAVDDRAKAIFNTFSLFDELKEKEEISSQTLAKNLRDQVSELDDWAQNIESLSRRGIDEGLLEELRQMGPKANAEISALNRMTDYELTEYSNLWKRKYEIAREQAVKEMKVLREDVDAEIRGLTQDLENIMSTEMPAAGFAAAAGFWNGLNVYELQDKVHDYFKNIVEIIKVGVFDEHSPSRVLADIGKNVALGFIVGVDSMSDEVSKVMDNVFGDLATLNDIGSIDMNLNRHDHSSVTAQMPELFQQTKVAQPPASFTYAPIQHFHINSELDIDMVSRKLNKQTSDYMRSKGLVTV